MTSGKTEALVYDSGVRLGIESPRGTGHRALIIVLIALAFTGLYMLIFQQWRSGLGVTGMNTPTYWGLYIVNFAFFIGLSAGGILVSALAHVGGVKQFAPVSRISEILAVICLFLAQIFIFVDMGRPERLLNLVSYGWTQRWESPLIWDVTIVLAYELLAIGLLYYSTRADLVRTGKNGTLYRILTLGNNDISETALKKDKRMLYLLAFISIPGAVALHSITAWIFGLMVARPGWNTAIIAPLFVTSAIVSGLALVTVVAYLSRRSLSAPVKDDTIKSLGKVIMWLIPVLGYLMFSELLTIMYAGSVGHASAFQDIISGRYAGLFWLFVLGLLIPFLILLINRGRSAGLVVFASILLILGVWLERFILIIPPQLNAPLLPQGSYTPSGPESLIMIGIIAFGALIYILLAQRIPLVPEEYK